MANEFGGPSASQSFLVGLASSTMGAFKEEHDKLEADNFQKKQIDYQLLMKAMEQIQSDQNLTPSQKSAATQEIMNRSIDIFKPKGHQDIKDRIKEIFGGGQQYQPRGVGDVLTRAGQRPRANVAMPTQTATPGGEGADQIRARTVTMPPPPQGFRPELTEREQVLEDQDRHETSILHRQMSMQKERELYDQHKRDEQNAVINKRTMDVLKYRTEAQTELAITRELGHLGLFQDTPDNRRIAAESLRQGRESKLKLSASHVELLQKRTSAIDSQIAQGWASLGIRQTQLESNNNLKVANSLVNTLITEMKVLWKQAAEAHQRYARDGDETALTQADEFERQADEKSTQIQDIQNKSQEYVQQLTGRVSLPNGPYRSGAKLTRAEILAAGGTEKDVEEARRRGVLARRRRGVLAQ